MHYFIGASLSEPHIDESHAQSVCLYGTTVTRCAAHTQYIVRIQIIFRAIQTACCNVCVLHCASVQLTLPRAVHCTCTACKADSDQKEMASVNDQRDSSTSAQEQRERRLQRRKERERAHHAAETAEQREARLARRASDRARRAAQTKQQRQAPLHADVKG